MIHFSKLIELCSRKSDYTKLEKKKSLWGLQIPGKAFKYLSINSYGYLDVDF